MPVIFAEAGLGAAADLCFMGISWVCFLLSIVLCVIAFQRRSSLAALCACAIVFFYTLMFMPWMVFVPLEPEAYKDPDIVEALPPLYATGVGWIATCLVVIGAAYYALPNYPYSFGKLDPASESNHEEDN